jgi:hypothetical protein
MTARFQPHLDSQALLRRQCRQALSADATAAFQQTLQLHRADLLTDLFPALRDAMAGSDPVCIREMQAAMALQLDALESAWRAAREAVPATAALTDALLGACEQLLIFENTQAWPMAERLLDDAALAQLAQAQRARRA